MAAPLHIRREECEAGIYWRLSMPQAPQLIVVAHMPRDDYELLVACSTETLRQEVLQLLARAELELEQKLQELDDL